ncbi:hypothetical protein Q9R29_04505 [Rothia sp. ARF10]|nr:hypothetical protein [Rothia sp. ARF10]
MILAALAAVLFTAPPAAAAEPRPFTSDFTIEASFAPMPVPGVFAVTTSGAGHASHLGKVTVSSSETLDFVSSPGTVTLDDGRLVMTAANGDQLYWSYEGTGSAPDENGESALAGTFVITGGTGRFSDAAGDGSLHGTGNAVTGMASLTYHGSISY